MQEWTLCLNRLEKLSKDSLFKGFRFSLEVMKLIESQEILKFKICDSQKPLKHTKIQSWEAGHMDAPLYFFSRSRLLK